MSTEFDIPAPPEVRPEQPVPFGVRADSGELHPELGTAQPELDLPEAQDRGAPTGSLDIVPGFRGDLLEQAGWGLVLASDADPRILEQLEPLIEWRRKQVGTTAPFKVYSRTKGVAPDQNAISWLSPVGLAPVDPDNGVPLYLLLVGPPSRISYEFQYTLDLHWCVGRIDFDTPEEYGLYARAVVAYESAAQPMPKGKQAAMWMPANGDLATTLLCNDVGLPLLRKKLGQRFGFEVSAHMAGKATKATLRKLLQGPQTPALLFTGSHGLEWPAEEPERQRERQGALVTQEWKPSKAKVPEGAYFAAEDVPADADLTGMIHVMFACFGGGCPDVDNYPGAEATPGKLMAAPIVSRLAQRLLTRGALAVVGHVDRAWSYSFQSGSGMPQNQLLKGVLDSLMLGDRVGLALDLVNGQWGVLAASLGLATGPRAAQTSPAALANLMIARDDARNYTVIGDPAVRLRV